jgi:hypothetical protein
MKSGNFKSSVITIAVLLGVMGLTVCGFFLWRKYKEKYENALTEKHVWVFENGQYAVERPENTVSPGEIRKIIKDFELKAGKDEELKCSRLTMYVHASPKAQMYMLKKVLLMDIDEIRHKGRTWPDARRIFLKETGDDEWFLIWNQKKRRGRNVIDMGDIYLNIKMSNPWGRRPVRKQNESLEAFMKRTGPWITELRISGKTFKKADGYPDFIALSRYLSKRKKEYKPPSGNAEDILEIYLSIRDRTYLKDVFTVLRIVRNVGITSCTVNAPEIPW